MEIKSKIRKKRNNGEQKEQIAFFEELAWKYPKWFEIIWHNPSGGERPSKTYINKKGIKKRYSPQGKTLKAMGAKKGVPDVTIPVRLILTAQRDQTLYSALYIEFKSSKGVLSGDQQNMKEKLESCGNLFAIARSAKEAMDIFEGIYCPQTFKTPAGHLHFIDKSICFY